MDTEERKRLEKRIGKIVRLYSGAKVKIQGLRTDEREMEAFAYYGLDENDKKCWIKETAIRGNSDNMIREPVW